MCCMVRPRPSWSHRNFVEHLPKLASSDVEVKIEIAVVCCWTWTTKSPPCAWCRIATLSVFKKLIWGDALLGLCCVTGRDRGKFHASSSPVQCCRWRVGACSDFSAPCRKEHQCKTHSSCNRQQQQKHEVCTQVSKLTVWL